MAENEFSPEGAEEAERSYPLKLTRNERKVNRKRRALIIRNGKSLKYKSLLVSIYPQEKWKLSLVLTRKTAGAVNRNRIKRIIREVYRATKPFFNQPQFFAVTVLHNPEKLTFNNLKNKILQVYCS